MFARIFCFIISLLFSFSLSAQLTDDFQDGDLLNPTWMGQADRFDVVNGELVLQDEDNMTPSYLYLPAATSISENTTWEILVRTEFNPSANNHAIVYLSATNPNLDGDQFGYFLKIGGISGSEDAIELFRQDGSSTSLVLSGAAGAAANDPVVARIRVLRSTDGSWQLFTDYTGGTNFTLEGAAIDDTYSQGQFFGVLCNYTSSNATDNFFFDDILVDPLFVDIAPPNLVSWTATSSTAIALQYDEPLDATIAENVNNYTIDGGIGNPASAQLDGMDPALILLNLANALEIGETYNLNIENIADVSGNIASSSNVPISFVIPEEYDVLINEIMANPPDGSVPGSLPAGAEYVELYNRSEKVLNLEGWTFSDASSTQELSSFDLQPGAYVILCDDGNISSFEPFGDVLAVASFPSLNNTGDNLNLSAADGTSIHQVNYTADWYQDDEKDDGGWSLELINPLAPCQGLSNWLASNDLSGGTPGIENSVFLPEQDMQGPEIEDVFYDVSLNAFVLTFSENLDGTSIAIEDFAIDPTLGGIDQIEYSTDVPDQVILFFGGALSLGVNYTITVMDSGITDCQGNPNNTALTSVFRIAQAYDVLIHEIMANPPNASAEALLPAVEYIELFNRTEAPINLNEWKILVNTSDEIFPAVTIEPGGFLIICDAEDVDSLSSFGAVVGIPGLPGLTNAGSTLTLLDRNGQFVDRVPYTDEWYQSTGKSGGGWSLELINPLNYCEGITNWRASNDLTGGTPGVVNSVFEAVEDQDGPEILYVIPPDAPGQIQVVFSEDIDLETAQNTASYDIDQGVAVIGVEFNSDARNVLSLILFPELEQGVVYTLSTTNTLADCQGNPVKTITTTDFALPDQMEVGDLIISEVMPNPEVGGKDFIEVYNTTSDKIFDLNDLILANLSNDQDTSLIDPPSAFSFPGDYSVFTTSRVDILERYTVPNPERLFRLSGFPTFPADAGNVTLYIRNNDNEIVILEEFDYTADLHNALLDDTRGVSLERVNSAIPASENSNWASAAQEVGFATPTGPNSQSGGRADLEIGVFDLESETFSPDGDGFEDQLRINYELEGPDYIVNLRIFDVQGRLIKDLEQNTLLAANGTLVWEGDTDEGGRARVGIYILWIELFKPDGTITYQQLTGVLASQF